MSQLSDTANALCLGALQGVTEFLPISSDGHLATFALFFTVPTMSLALVVLLHAGTLIATLSVFGRDVLELLRVALDHKDRPKELLGTLEGQMLLSVAVACVPTAVIGLGLEDHVEWMGRVRWIVGAGFLASAVAVASTRGKSGSREVLGIGGSLLLGFVQGLAVLPGVSRSGLTIACAMALGMSAPAAFRFSFLLSMPVIAGVTVLQLGKPGVLASLDSMAWLGAGTALVTGYVALRVLGAVLRRGHFWLFSLYLVPLGALLVAMDLLGAR